MQARSKFLAAVIGIIALSTSAKAATITFLLAPFANGNGQFAANEYAVWAWTSLGDNGGIAAFTFTLNGQATTTNRSPRATFSDPDFALEPKTSGFTLLRSTGGSGVPTTGAFDTVSGNGVARYGVGQSTGNLNTSTPEGYVPLSTTAQASYGLITQAAGGPLTPPPGGIVYTGGAIPVLLATGTFTTSSVSISSADGNVFTNTSGSLVSRPTIVIRTGGFVTTPEPAGLTVLCVLGTVLTRRARSSVRGRVTA